MYSFPDLEPFCCSISSSNCCSLTCIQISQEAGQVVRYSHLFKNFPQFVVIHTVKGFGTVNKAEVDVFLELSYFFNDPTNVGNLISGTSAFSKSSLNIWKFTVHVLLKPGLANFEHYFTNVCCCQVALVVSDSVWPHRRQPTRLRCPWDSPGKNTGVRCHFLLQCLKVKSESEVAQLCPTPSDPMDCSLPSSSVHTIFEARLLEWVAIAFSTGVWDECNCTVVWAFFGIAFLWDWNENWPFPVPWPLLSFPNLLAYWVQYFHSIIF